LQKGRFMKYVVIDKSDMDAVRVLFIGNDKAEVQGWLGGYKKMTDAAGLWNAGDIVVAPYDDE